MRTVSETIPDALQTEVDAAVAWYNREHAASLEVTGIVDAEVALRDGPPHALRLVLCGGDRCEQRTFLVESTGGGLSVALLDDAEPSLTDATEAPAELDPPPGARRGWLADVASRHAFVVLIFYRGFW